jgi:hypothetical protein
MSDLTRPFRPAGSDRVDPVLVTLWCLLVAIAAFWVAPFVFIVFSSLKSNGTVMGTSAFSPPLHPEWSNYASAWGPSQAAAILKLPPARRLLANSELAGSADGSRLAVAAHVVAPAGGSGRVFVRGAGAPAELQFPWLPTVTALGFRPDGKIWVVSGSTDLAAGAESADVSAALFEEP